MSGHVLVIDQGTTSTRAVVFDGAARAVASAQMEFPQIFPRPGWVEHDPEDIWRTTLATAREALATSGVRIAAIGITNQRETTLIWDRKTGKPIYNAVVWQDRRTADRCAELKHAGQEARMRRLTGLVLDPYFSATKIAWILDNVPGARARAARGELAFGTVDSFLLWRLTGGGVHATDITNASRTALLDIHSGRWSDELLAIFDIPRSVLPKVRETADTFGSVDPEHLGVAVPILAMAGDQQAALIGQNCLSSGMAKATFGTGAFILLNTGSAPVEPQGNLLTTIAYRWDGQTTYAVEGSIFSAGATVQWLRDGLGLITHAAEAAALAAESDHQQEVYLVPAFAGLGAPHWQADARGTIVGLTRGSTRKEIARAALESVGYQTADLLDVMTKTGATQNGTAHTVIRVDGGMAASDWTMQFLADIVGAPVDRPTFKETTSMGTALLAGWRAGLYPGPDQLGTFWQLDRRFTPTSDHATRTRQRRGWNRAVARTLHGLETAR